MGGVVVRDAHGLVDQRQLPRALQLGGADAPLDVPHRIDVLGYLGPVARPQDPLQALQLGQNGVDDGPVAFEPGQPRGRIRAAAGTEQALEDGAGIPLDGQRRGRRPPRDGVRVGAARAPIAGAHHRIRLDAELQRRELRLPGELARGHLVHRHRRVHIGAGRQLERGRGQERARRSRVIAAPFHEVRRLVGQTAQEQHPVLEPRQ